MWQNCLVSMLFILEFSKCLSFVWLKQGSGMLIMLLQTAGDTRLHDGSVFVSTDWDFCAIPAPLGTKRISGVSRKCENVVISLLRNAKKDLSAGISRSEHWGDIKASFLQLSHRCCHTKCHSDSSSLVGVVSAAKPDWCRVTANFKMSTVNNLSCRQQQEWKWRRQAGGKKGLTVCQSWEQGNYKEA